MKHVWMGEWDTGLVVVMMMWVLEFTGDERFWGGYVVWIVDRREAFWIRGRGRGSL
jgi:hypothetical protein